MIAFLIFFAWLFFAASIVAFFMGCSDARDR